MRGVDTLGGRRLRAFVAYGRKVFDLRQGFESVRDGRRQPKVAPSLVAAAIFFCGLLRTRSLNALEPKLRERPFRRLIAALPDGDAIGSADTLGRALRRIDLPTVQALSVGIIEKAERNKVFREGWHGALHTVAIDGWEPICLYNRHCDRCLVRQVRVELRDGTVVEKEQYYHRYVVAMLVDERFDMALDIEQLLPHDLRPKGASKNDEDEGELTAAIRLLRRGKQTFGWLELVVADGLYPNGPFLTVVKQLHMSAVIIARKNGDEPLKEALAIWGDKPPQEVVDDKKVGERIELWDCRDIRTLDTYDGPIRVVHARVTYSESTKPPGTWCMVVTGAAATRLLSLQVLKIGRGRWHIENTGFHQWTTRWYFDHVFVHDGHGIQALYWLFFAAFNLLTIFLYRQVRSYGRDHGKDVTRTISRLVDEMLDDLARLDRSPWDTS